MDQSPVKVWEKSRRIGATYVQAYEDVLDCARGAVPGVWFSSADESAAREYIREAERWVRVVDTAARFLGSVVIDSERDIKALTIEFANGTKINALTSNPTAFRSKGGKVVIDEFAHHEHAEELWAAARPCVTWGYPLRIISTHSSPFSLFARFCNAIRDGTLRWSLHTVDIHTAVSEGLLDKIVRRRTTDEERKAWIADLRANCLDEDVWLREYCVRPSGSKDSFLSLELIRSAMREDCLKSSVFDATGPLYLGMDIGRLRDLSVIWVLEKRGGALHTVHVLAMEGTPFHEQREALWRLLSHPALRRAAIDATGVGMQLAEEARERFGRSRVEEVHFTQPIKEELAFSLRSLMEEGRLSIPQQAEIEEDLYSVRKITTTTGNIRFEAAPT
ncbi:MAG: terminase family protein, partial [Candidatus Caldarchaeum sp.]